MAQRLWPRTARHSRRSFERRLGWFALTVLFTSLATLGIISTAHAQGITLPSGISDTELNHGLSYPTAMDVAPDGRVFYTQKNGWVRIIKNGTILSNPFLIRSVSQERERGLFGIALDPNFAQNQYVYIRYTTSGTCHNILERVTAQGDVVQPGSGTILLDMGACMGVGSHNGGTIHFGAGGKLFTTIGEQGCCPNNAQSFSNLFGKILRLNLDGTIPTDNPFYNSATGNNRAIWAYGLRNPFVFAVQPGTGQILINDVGQGSFEEINRGIAGANYGWPACEGACNPPNPAYVNPIYAYTHSEGCSITGGAFYNPAVNQFPANYTGKYFFTDWCGGWIRTLDTASGAVTTFANGYHNEIGMPVDIDLAPDGSLYFLIQNAGDNKNDSSLHRIEISPLPGIAKNPRSLTVDAGATASFNVVASGNGPYSFQWQRNGVNIPGATSRILTFVATSADNGAGYRAIVSNAAGSATSKTRFLTVRTSGNTPPTATITLPAANARYRSGDTISFAGTGTDPQDGDLPASAFTWEFVFHHDMHTHDFIDPKPGVKSGSFQIPLVDELESNVWYRIHLTVRDAQGLSATTTRDIFPFTSTITLASDPPGLELTIDGRIITTPYTFVSVENQPRALGVVSPQSLNGVTYRWASWSDGGAETHEFPTPQNDQTFTATFTPTSDNIFSNGFEGGGILSWTNAWTDNGDISVTTAAALVEKRGMQEVIDDNTPISLVDAIPAGEARYRARFYIDPNSTSMANGDSYVLFFGYSGGGFTRPVVVVELQFWNGAYQLRAGLAHDDTSWRRGAWVTIDDAPHFAEIDWRAASGPGMSDGGLGFWVDGVQRSNLSGVDNDTWRIDTARLGANAGIDNGTRGVTFIDGFVSRRTTYIGPAPGANVAVAEGLVIEAAQLNYFTDEPEPAEYTELPAAAPDKRPIYLPFMGR